ncbi:MAG: AAA family ATPase [Thiocapsa sp.]|uniref:AAA family ATPase n=1 Tax=Thiocapsa sp. TaxID=2024551 RepID=UPI001BD09084|nr:AAA family ATPase [Thiocapsa sp.]QVL50283.1 MAG: AAA family ATPase [Thiocapsa sp.]
MYEAFFNLREKPFSLLPDPGFLFMSQKHQEALTLLEYGLLNQAGFIVLTGEIGSGKTTLMRYLLERLDKDVIVGLISHTHKSLGNLNHWICSAFDIRPTGDSKLDLHSAIIDFLIDRYSKGKRVLLIVDEAQNLGVEKLEELRLLSNINAEKDLILQLMLLGQPQLRDLLQHPDLEQFVQRVSASYHLGRLDAEETEHYIEHRIFVAGGKRPIFTKDACRAVHHYSGGIPRIINLLCDTSLVYAYGAGEKRVTGAAIDDFVSSHAPHLLIPIAGDTQRPKRPEGSREDDTLNEATWADGTPLEEGISELREVAIEPGSQDQAEAHAMPLPPGSWPAAPSPAPTGQPSRLPETDLVISKVLKNDVKETIPDQDNPFFVLAQPPQPTIEKRPNRVPRTLAAISLLLIMGLATLWFGGTTTSENIRTRILSWFMPTQPPSNNPATIPENAESSQTEIPASSASTNPLVESTVEPPQTEVEPPQIEPAQGTEMAFGEDSELGTVAAPGSEGTTVDSPALIPGTLRAQTDTASTPTEAEVVNSEEIPAIPDPLATEVQELARPEPSTRELGAMRSGSPENDASPPEVSSRDQLTEVETTLRNLSLELEWEEDDRLVANLGQSVQFDDGSTELDAPAAERISEIAKLLKDHENIRIHVVGHTDSSGRQSVNRWLSDRRADVVARFLLDRGISPERVTHEGRGQTELKFNTAQENIQGPWINRRIELELLAKPR